MFIFPLTTLVLRTHCLGFLCSTQPYVRYDSMFFVHCIIENGLRYPKISEFLKNIKNKSTNNIDRLCLPIVYKRICRITRSGPKSMILHIESHSNLYLFLQLPLILFLVLSMKDLCTKNRNLDHISQQNSKDSNLHNLQRPRFGLRMQ